MIRGEDNNGCVILGLTRKEVDAIVKGAVCCFHHYPPGAPREEQGPHICIYFGETNADVIAALQRAYPEDASMQRALGAPVDYRTKPERGDN